jgi:deoxyribodipyrimidine photo-lyase
MQKLEDEPAIEFRNFARSADGLRPGDVGVPMTAQDEERLAAWCEGRTGFPMVDACMRSLRATGWLNFRMRAMLVSFAAYHLWLHWTHTAPFLARAFLDFEPGIHYSQFQMQSGTTGINTLRIYSPAKQVLDHDPEGAFIRAQLPALSRVPARDLAEPHRMPASAQRAAGCIIGRDYPAPVVDHACAYRQARERFAAIRRSTEARIEAALTAVGADWIEYEAGPYATETDVFLYSVLDGFGAEASGVIRVGIASVATGSTSPSAAPDAVVVRPGRTIVVDRLAT